MSDIGSRLDEAFARALAANAEEDAEEDKAAESAGANESEREQRQQESHGAAVVFKMSCIEPLMNEIAQRFRDLAGGTSFGHTDSDRGYVGSGYGFVDEVGDKESIWLKVYFDEYGVLLVVEACCIGIGTIYNQKSGPFSVAEFDKGTAQQWIEDHSVWAVKAFARKARSVRNPSSVVAQVYGSPS